SLKFGEADGRGVAEARVGRGRVLRGDALEDLLAGAGIAREAMVDRGLAFARQKSGESAIYFVSNGSQADISDWIPLSAGSGAVAMYDPMRGEVSIAPVRANAGGHLEV